MGRCALWMLVLGTALSGCTQSPFAPGPQQGAFWRQPANDPPHVAQLQELDQRNRHLDANNSDLHKQLAQAQQQLTLLRDDNNLLRKQLAQVSDQFEAVQLAKEQAERDVQTLQASTRFRGGAMIKANSSVKQGLTPANLPGLDVRPDGEVIRISIPADQLFAPGTVQWQSTAPQLLDQVAQAITTYYPRQHIAVEGHTDNATLREGSDLMQLGTSQALAVVQYLTQRAKLPERQLFNVGYGPHQPLVSNGTPAGQAKNRRIEIVINPETLD